MKNHDSDRPTPRKLDFATPALFAIIVIAALFVQWFTLLGPAVPVLKSEAGASAANSTIRSTGIETDEVSALTESSPTTFRDPIDQQRMGPEMVPIPAGHFVMGTAPGDALAQIAEQPVHESTFSRSFALSKTETTFADYEFFARVTGRALPSDNHWGRGNRPVVHVSWYDARDYAEWLTKKTGKTYRLPTEAEWEYAALAGNTTAYYWGNELLQNKANCLGCNGDWKARQTSPVGYFGNNAFGLHDMAGNVWEWTEDCWHDNYVGAPSSNRAWVSSGCERRVVRGGSCLREPICRRSAYRIWEAASARIRNFGFRVVRML